MTVFVKWLVGMLADKLLAALGAFIAGARRDRANVEKGAAQARAEGLQQEAESEDRAQVAINKARDRREAGLSIEHTEYRD